MVLMARARLAFIFTWGVLMVFAQPVILIIGSAIGYEPYSMGIIETLAAILTVMATTIMLVKEDFNGKENNNKEFRQDKW